MFIGTLNRATLHYFLLLIIISISFYLPLLNQEKHTLKVHTILKLCEAERGVLFMCHIKKKCVRHAIFAPYLL